MSVQSGRDAESRAAVFLAGRGYRILRRNYTVRGAEVDIIAKDGETYVFVEVKSLSSLAHGAPRPSASRPKSSAGFAMPRCASCRPISCRTARCALILWKSRPKGPPCCAARLTFADNTLKGMHKGSAAVK